MASGNLLCSWSPLSNMPPSSNMATLDVRNGHYVLEFDSATAESAVFPGVLPSNYAGGGLTIVIVFMVDTATSGNVVWGTSIERHDDEGTDLDADSFAAESTVTAAAPATTGMVQYASTTHTSGAQMDSLVALESFRLKVRRVASDAADTVNSNDAQLLRVFIRET